MRSMEVARDYSRGSNRPFRQIDGFGRYEPSGPDFVDGFRRLVRQWRSDTAYSSSLDEKFGHPAFLKIERMGYSVISSIIEELERQPDWLCEALTTITNENPIADSDRGDVYAAATAWIEWYRRR